MSRLTSNRHKSNALAVALALVVSFQAGPTLSADLERVLSTAPSNAVFNAPYTDSDPQADSAFAHEDMDSLDMWSGVPHMQLSREALVTCGDLAFELSESVVEAIESVEACITSQAILNWESIGTGTSSDEKALPALGPLAYQMYMFAYAALLRYAPAALPALNRMISSYRGPIYGDTVTQLRRDLVNLLRKHKFKCPSSTNPLTCRR